jgi:hypothetical protein
MTDCPGLIRFVFFMGIKNAHPRRSASSRGVCTSVNPAKGLVMERRRKFRSRSLRVKAPACAPSGPALMVVVVYHSCREKSSEKCRGVRASGWGKKVEGAILLRPADGLALPQQGSHFLHSPLTYTLQLHRGDTVYLSNSRDSHGLTVSQAAHRMDGLRDSNCAHKVGHGQEKG